MSRPLHAFVVPAFEAEDRVAEVVGELRRTQRDAEITRTQAQARGDAARIAAEGEAAATIVRGKAQAEAQAAINKTLTSRYLQFKAFDLPNATYYFVPIGRNGLPVIVNAEPGRGPGR